MQKLRNYELKNLISEQLSEKFHWVKNIKMIASTVPGEETYEITSWYEFKKNDTKMQDFEKFVKCFFEVSKGRASMIFCWRHTELILMIFKPTH